ncbi:MAG: ACT domain-containing protein [Acidimicrobiales bacterium]
MGNYLIRVQLPDRPGALGAVASRIGSVGGDVVSIEILERQGSVVIDELGVGLPDGLIDLVEGEILEVDGVNIEHVRPLAGALPDRYGDLLTMTRELFTRSSLSQPLQRLVDGVRQGLFASFAAAVDASTWDPVATAGTAPDLQAIRALARRATSASTHSPSDESEASTSAAMMVQHQLVLIVAREAPILRDRERKWLAITAEIADLGTRVRSAG